MPKLRPLRTQEEISAVPADESVLIELTAESSVASAEPEIKIAEVKTTPEPAAEKKEEQGSESPLQKQLEDLKKAEAEARRQLAESQVRERAAINAANQRGEQLYVTQGEREQARYDAVLNAIGAAQAEADKAQNDLAAAMAASDFTVAAEAQRRLSIATTRLVQLEDGKVAFEAQLEQTRQEPLKPASPTDPIDGMTQLSSRQREWLKTHREAFTDQEKNADLGYWHRQAVKKNIGVDSDAYYAFIEENMGYREPEQKTQDDDEPPPQRRSMPMSAPVSRDSPSLSTGRSTPTRVELTAAQREAARISGVDDVTYARNLLRLNNLKQQGHYQERG